MGEVAAQVAGHNDEPQRAREQDAIGVGPAARRFVAVGEPLQRERRRRHKRHREAVEPVQFQRPEFVTAAARARQAEGGGNDSREQPELKHQ